MIKATVNTSKAHQRLTLMTTSLDSARVGFFKFLVVEFQQLIRKIMDAQGTYGGEKQWKVLSPSTSNAPYRKNKGGSPTADILHPKGAGGFLGTFQKLRETHTTLYFGSNKRVNGYQLSAIHQYGAVINRPEIKAPPGRFLKYFSVQQKKFVFAKRVGPATIVIPPRKHVYVPTDEVTKFKKVWHKFLRSMRGVKE